VGHPISKIGLSAEEPTQAKIGLEWATILKDLHLLHRQQDYEQHDRGLGAVGIRRQRRKGKYSFGNSITEVCAGILTTGTATNTASANSFNAVDVPTQNGGTCGPLFRWARTITHSENEGAPFKLSFSGAFLPAAAQADSKVMTMFSTNGSAGLSMTRS
jgi:hypothetical protein